MAVNTEMHSDTAIESAADDIAAKYRKVEDN
jgi:hypothetical protein